MSQPLNNTPYGHAPDVVIGELITTGDTIKEERCPIEVWPGYGVTCYTLGTLNGSIPAIARHLIDTLAEVDQMRRELSDPSFTVRAIIDGTEVDHLDVERLIDQLKSLYLRHNVAS